MRTIIITIFKNRKRNGRQRPTRYGLGRQNRYMQYACCTISKPSREDDETHRHPQKRRVRERGRARDNRKHYDAPNRKNDAHTHTHTKYLHLNDKMELKIISKQLKRKVSLTE